MKIGARFSGTIMIFQENNSLDISSPSSPLLSLHRYASIAGVIGVKKMAPQLAGVVEDYIPFIGRIPEGIPRQIYAVLFSGSAVWLMGIYTSRSTLLVGICMYVCMYVCMYKWIN